MENKIYAPFTPDQVAKLNTYQDYHIPHPFTCCSPEQCKNCQRRIGTSDGVLIATPDGWVCPCGEYTQTWAHAFMADGEWLAKQAQFLEDFKAGKYKNPSPASEGDNENGAD